jgi:uncharacterized membrane protein YcaP (DUF421 family)
LFESMFHMPLSILEKILRPMIVYLALIVFLRLFGKRELAQLNPFDLVVLLSLSNTVQNAMIGDDNSVSGGIIGAFALLAINWLLMRVLFRMPKINQTLQGKATTLITNGVVDYAALRQETLTEEELLSVLHKQSFDTFEEVRRCVLEPNGTFYIEAKKPTEEEEEVSELLMAVRKLTNDVSELRAELRRRDDERNDIAGQPHAV